MNRLRNYQRGGSPIVVILVVLIIAGLIYVGFQIGLVQLAYMNIKEKTKAEMMYVMVPPFEDVESKVRQKIVGLLEEANAEYKDDQIVIELSENKRTMTVKIWFAKPHNLPFYQNPKQLYIELEHKAPSI